MLRMKKLISIFIFSWILMAGNVWAQKVSTTELRDNLWLISDVNICCNVTISAAGNFIDEQETNGIDGLNLVAYLPEGFTNLVRRDGFSFRPVILFSQQIKVLNLITDLPPPLLS